MADLLVDYGAVVEMTSTVYEKLCEASLQEDVQVPLHLCAACYPDVCMYVCIYIYIDIDIEYIYIYLSMYIDG